MPVCPCCGQELPGKGVVALFASGMRVSEAARAAGISQTGARNRIHKACIELAGGMPPLDGSHSGLWYDGRLYGGGFYPNTSCNRARPAWQYLLRRRGLTGR